jgi:hypothetical protein
VNEVSEVTKSGHSQNETGGMSAIIGVVLILISIFLIILGSYGQPQGQVVQVPNGRGNYDYIPLEGYAHPYDFLVPVGTLGLIVGLMLVVVGAATTERKTTPNRSASASSASSMFPDIGRQGASFAQIPRPLAAVPSQHELPSVESRPTTASSHRRNYGIRASDQIVQASPFVKPTATGSDMRKETPVREKVPWTVEFVVPRPRMARIELELRLFQLKSWRDRGLITRKNYEEEKNKAMRRLHPPHTMI